MHFNWLMHYSSSFYNLLGSVPVTVVYHNRRPYSVVSVSSRYINSHN